MRVCNSLKDISFVLPVLFTAGCGNGGGGPIEPGPDRSLACDTGPQWYSEGESAVYRVIVRYWTNRDNGEQAEQFLGTAFAVDERTLATNAHIIRAILVEVFPYVDVSSVVVRQSGTDSEFRVTAWAAHADSNLIYELEEQSTHLADVAVLKVAEDLPGNLDLANDRDLQSIQKGDLLYLAGFPGDVVALNPSATALSASLLDGRVSNFSDFDGNGTVAFNDADIIQHTIATSGGTSGSPIVHCGKVVAINYGSTTDTYATNRLAVNIHSLKKLIGDIASDSIPTLPLIDTGNAIPMSSGCGSECDYCHVGTANEGNCPLDWNGDSECDCGCQFDDLDCPATGSLEGSGCTAVCDYCNLESEYENNCPTSWYNDGECDCGCQFDDADCQ